MSSPPPLPSHPSYEARLSALERVRRFRIQGDSLHIEEEGHSRALPLDQIRTIRCRFHPTRIQRNRYETLLTLANGMEIKIGNQFYRGPANFEDRSGGYRAFVQALHHAVANGNRSCRFFAGATPLSFWLNAAFFGTMILVLSILLIVFAFSIPAVAIVKLVILIILLPVAVDWFRKNKPDEYDGREIPDSVLP